MARSHRTWSFKAAGILSMALAGWTSFTSAQESYLAPPDRVETTAAPNYLPAEPSGQALAPTAFEQPPATAQPMPLQYPEQTAALTEGEPQPEATVAPAGAAPLKL
jgi:hypothetical protein